MPDRTRRTLQYAPGDTPEKVRAAADGAADGVIIDLESTVDPPRKDAARENLQDYLGEIDFGTKEVIVRINGLRTDRWLGDLSATIDAGADTVRLPKIEHPTEVERAVETASQLTDSPPEFLLQLETPKGVLHGREIATTCAELPDVTGIGIGIGDYTKSLGLDGHTPELRAYLLNTTAAVAEVGNMDPLAYVHKELETLRSAAATARSLGHVGQPVSHTVDTEEFVAVLNDVYSG